MSDSTRQGAPFFGPDAPNWTIYKIVKATAGRVALWLYRTKLVDTFNVPDGPCILSGNHVSYADPALLWSARLKQPTHFVSKDTLYKNSLVSWFLDNIGVMPVARGTADRLMISRATKLLAAGEQLGIFPEGTRVRGGDPDALGEAHGGVAFISVRANVPIVPIGLAGTDEIMPPGSKFPRFPKVVIKFGKPLYPDDFEGDRKGRVDAITAELMVRIAQLRNEAREMRQR